MEPDDDPALPANLQLNTDTPELTHMIDRMHRDQARLTNRTTRLQAAPPDLREIPDVGRYMLVREQSYAAHHELVADKSLQLGYSPSQQPAFDPQFTNFALAAQPHLTVLRNFIMGEYFKQNATQAKVDALKAIAEFASKLPVEASPKGIQQLYLRLLKRQHTPLILMPSVWFAKIRPSQWQLPPLEVSPFSDEALIRPAPKPDTNLHAVESVSFVDMVDRDHLSLEETQQQEQSHEQGQAEELNAIANDMASAGALTMSVEELHEPTKRESIELAKEILNKLRVKMGEAFISHGLSPFAIEKLLILSGLREVVKAFEFHLHKIAGLDANIYENPAVVRANQAVGKLSYIAKKETLLAAKQQNDTQMAALIEADLAQFPSGWLPAENEQFGMLFDDLQSGLEAVLDRLTQIGDKDASAEFWLGFSSEKAIGSVDPSKGRTGKQEKTMAEDQYYRQLNAQRALRARQAAVRYTQSMQRQRLGHHDHDDHHPSAPTAKTTQSMTTMLSDDLISSMRNAMKTSANAGSVQTGTKANIQNVIKQKDQAMRAQRQRVTVEQITRANKRSQDMHHDDHHDDLKPPTPHKKKDHGHGM
jgi:hypothetical protein